IVQMWLVFKNKSSGRTQVETMKLRSRNELTLSEFGLSKLTCETLNNYVENRQRFDPDAEHEIVII
ncbi:hypothetical protein BgiMline_011468, partial [Biomphalaria glabrata]